MPTMSRISRERVAEMRETLTEKRVRLVSTTDRHTLVTAGTEGTVTFIDDLGTVFVHWDDGSTLGLLPGVDRYELVATAEIDRAAFDRAPSVGNSAESVE